MAGGAESLGPREDIFVMIAEIARHIDTKTNVPQ